MHKLYITPHASVHASTIQQAIHDDPAQAQLLIDDALAAQPRDPQLLRLQAELLARSGELDRAWDMYRTAAALSGQLIAPIKRSVCTICGNDEAELCWVGASHPTDVQVWVRCNECRTARRNTPPNQRTIDATRRAQLARNPMDVSRLHTRLQQTDALIDRIREEGYGMAWLNRVGGSGKANMLVMGSGWGELLASAEWRGFEVQGVESDTTAATWAQESLGVMVWPSLHSVPMVPQDVIVVASGLGEHADPAALLGALSRRLISGGLMVLNVPCHDHPVHRAQGYDDPRWKAPDAAVWFDRSGISLALLRTGMQPLRTWHHPQNVGDVLLLARKD